MEDRTKPLSYYINIKEKQKIWKLYFDEFYSYKELEDYFKGKYSYIQLKSVINERYQQYEHAKKTFG